MNNPQSAEHSESYWGKGITARASNAVGVAKKGEKENI